MTAVVSVQPEYVELFVRFLKEKDYSLLPTYQVRTILIPNWAIFNVDIDTWVNIHDHVSQSI
jgi:hypothetical protein